MGLLRQVLPQPPEPRHRLRWLGQARQGAYTPRHSTHPAFFFCDDLVTKSICYFRAAIYRYENKTHLVLIFDTPRVRV